MKRVLKTPMVAHVWAQQTQDEGRNPQGNFYFRGATIYSYRDNYPLATFVTRKGKGAALMRLDCYSNTTARHKHLAFRAIPGRVFHVATGYDGCAPDHKANRANYAERLEAATLAAARARTSTAALEQAGNVAREANEYAEFFGLAWRLLVPRWSDQYRDEVRARAKALSAKKAVETKAREEKLRADFARRVAIWRETGGAMVSDSVNTLLRVNGNRIETSRGAEVPLRVAPAVWALVNEARTKGETLRPAIELGQFRLDAVEPDGTIRAGCHTIKFEELAAIAKQLNYKGAQ